MYSKETQKDKNKIYWNAIKKSLNKIPNSHGKKINWLNYPLNLKDTYLRLHSDKNCIFISIDIQVKDIELRELIWDQWIELRTLLDDIISYPSNWIKETQNSTGQSISQIRWDLDFKDFQNEPNFTINFYKEILIKFDVFYTEYGEILKNLIN